MTGRPKKQKPHTEAFVEFLASALTNATAGFRRDEWLAVDRIFQQAGLPLRLLRVGPEETISTAKERWTHAASGRSPSRRQIRIPSSSEWAALCDLIGVSSNRDLRETLEFARLVRDTDCARAKQDPTGWKELRALDRRVRVLALRRANGDVGANLSPPNTLSHLKALPKLIRLDHTRLCAWYVQHLIRQAQIWSTEGNQTQRNQARHLVEEIGKALVLSAGRGRPHGSRGEEPKVTPEQARRIFDDTAQKVKDLWITRIDERIPLLLDSLRETFGRDVIDRAFRPDPVDWLRSTSAVPSSAIHRITLVLLGVPRRVLQRLLARKT